MIVNTAMRAVEITNDKAQHILVALPRGEGDADDVFQIIVNHVVDRSVDVLCARGKNQLRHKVMELCEGSVLMTDYVMGTLTRDLSTKAVTTHFQLTLKGAQDTISALRSAEECTRQFAEWIVNNVAQQEDTKIMRQILGGKEDGSQR